MKTEPGAGPFLTAETMMHWLGRLVLLIFAVALGGVICFSVQRFWREYWVAKDGRQTTALLLQEHPKRVFDYRYSVDGKEHFGSGPRDWEDVKQHPAGPGQNCTAYYSSSHPWLASLRTESVWYVVGGLPFLSLMLLVEIVLASAAIAPNSKWLARLLGGNR